CELCAVVACVICFFLNGTPATEIYSLSLHDALPILSSCLTQILVLSRLIPWERKWSLACSAVFTAPATPPASLAFCNSADAAKADRKSTRLNSSHVKISYAVFCLKKKKITQLRDFIS